jgi:formylglycine-generating enzyme required for sulfatase activity
MMSLRTDMKRLRIILALACSLTTSTHAVAQARAAPRAAGTVFRDCRACPEMVVLPAGSFTMGSSAEEQSWAASHGGSMKAVADEAPQHQVSLPSFALGKYDVTRGEYAAFARETGYPAGDGCGGGRAIFKWEKDPKLTWDHPGHAQTDRDPVVCVSWQDARAYIAWLNRKAHRGAAASADGRYRLPSEAEWEYAARAGTTTRSTGAMTTLPLLSTPGSMPTPAAKKWKVFFATMARHIRWARSRRTHSAFTTWQGTFGSNCQNRRPRLTHERQRRR